VTSQPPAFSEVKSAQAWSVSPSKRSKYITADSDDEDEDGGEKFFCHLAVDSQRGLFYDFTWEEHRQNALAEPPSSDEHWGSGTAWKVDADDSSPSPAKKAPARSVKVLVESDSELDGTEDEYEETDDAEEEEDVEDELMQEVVEDEYDDPQTPSKKRKRTASPTKTPRKPRRTVAHPTPHSKAALRQRRLRQPTSPRKSPLKIRPPPPAPLAHRTLQLEKLPKDPWLRAMHMLHVGSRPDDLPCRDEEYAKVLRSVEELVGEGSGGCVCEFLL
jgi:origin recognition complex subunit 1